MPAPEHERAYTMPTSRHTTHTRDGALRRLQRTHRWLIAATITLTALLSDVAAHAFAGNETATSSAGAAKATTQGSSSQARSDKTSTQSLETAAQAPRAATQSTTHAQESVVSGGS
jgi:type VI protein secretion system component VasK